MINIKKTKYTKKGSAILKINIKEQDVGKRIDAFLAGNTEYSRAHIQKMIENEKVLVNGNKTKVSYKVQKDDEINFEVEVPKEIALEAQEIPIDVLYEDNDIIVVNKPKGMVVHPANGNYTGTLVNALLYRCKDSLSGIGGEKRPGIVHRLDKDTSGVLVVAKNDKAHINMSEQIKNHEVEKTYIALVKGFVKEEEATINMPIGRSTRDRKKMAVNKNGKNAVRVHLSEIGYPVVGDTTYSNGKNEWGIKGQCLHAKSLKFKHPITGKEMFIEAPLPEYFENVLQELRQGKLILSNLRK